MPQTQSLLDLLTFNVKTARGVYSRAQVDLLRTRLGYLQEDKPDDLADANEEFLDKLAQIARNSVQPTEFEVLSQANAELRKDILLILITTAEKASSLIAAKAFSQIVDIVSAADAIDKSLSASYDPFIIIEGAIARIKGRKNKDEREELLIAITPEFKRLAPLMQGNKDRTDQYLGFFRDMLIMAESQGGVKTLLENIRLLASECGVVLNVPLKGRENLDMVFGAIGEAMMIQRPSTPPPNPGRPVLEQTR
ncbi:MAG: hypothetical protein AB7G80_03790 [Dongiaceae bacterium]